MVGPAARAGLWWDQRPGQGYAGPETRAGLCGTSSQGRAMRDHQQPGQGYAASSQGRAMRDHQQPGQGYGRTSSQGRAMRDHQQPGQGYAGPPAARAGLCGTSSQGKTCCQGRLWWDPSYASLIPLSPYSLPHPMQPPCDLSPIHYHMYQLKDTIATTLA